MEQRLIRIRRRAVERCQWVGCEEIFLHNCVCFTLAKCSYPTGQSMKSKTSSTHLIHNPSGESFRTNLGLMFVIWMWIKGRRFSPWILPQWLAAHLPTLLPTKPQTVELIFWRWLALKKTCKHGGQTVVCGEHINLPLHSYIQKGSKKGLKKRKKVGGGD